MGGLCRPAKLFAAEQLPEVCVVTLMKQTRMGFIIEEPTRSKMGEVIGR